jgi:agmatine/peptidylarginine deiminase
MGYTKVDCLFFQNKNKNRHHKKAMKATWSDDSNPSSSDEKEFMANMCFMAIKNENELQSLDDESDPTYDELHDAFESLYDEFKKLGSKYSTLKKNYTCLLIKKKNFRKESLHCY